MKQLATLLNTTACLLALSVLTPSASAADLLAWWPMDEGTGTVLNDQSGNGYHGTLISGTWTADRFGSAGRAVALNNNRIDIPDSAKVQTVTLTAWINPTRYGSVSSPGCIFSAENGHGASGFVWRLAIIENGVLRMEAVAPYSTSTARLALSSQPLPLNEWHHVAGTYDGTTVKVYIDGQLVGSADYPTQTLLNTSSSIPSTIGYMSWGLQYFGGSIDEARIYDGVLTQAEIAALVAYEPPRPAVTVNDDSACYAGRIVPIAIAPMPDSPVKIQYSSDSGQSWTDIDSGVYTAGPMYWKIPESADGDSWRVRAASPDAALIHAVSDPFTIRPCSVTADLNGDCFVDMLDLAILASQWLSGERTTAP